MCIGRKKLQNREENLKIELNLCNIVYAFFKSQISREVSSTYGDGGIIWEIEVDVRALPCVKQIAVQHRELSSLFCGDLDGWDLGCKGDPRGRGYLYTYS